MDLRQDAWYLILATVCGAFLSIPIASAQTCAAPGSWHPDPTGAPPVVANTCTLPDSVALYCDIADSAEKNDAIYQLTFFNGFTATTISISGAAAGFNPVIFLYNGACATGGGCIQSGDVHNPMPLTGIPAGTYFLGASAAPSDATGACGVVTMSNNGYIPVELQSFDID